MGRSLGPTKVDGGIDLRRGWSWRRLRSVAAMRNRLTLLWERIGPRARDIGFIVFAALTAIGPIVFRRNDGTALYLLTIVAGTVSTAALWWRRQAPLAVTAVGLLAFVATEAPVVLGIGLFSLAIERRDRVLAAATAVSVLTVAAVTAANSAHMNWLEGLLAGSFGPGFCVAAGSYIGARRDLVASLRERAVRAEAERELRGEQAKLEERARIAREMHDVLAHKVSLIALHAGGLEVTANPEVDRVHATAKLIGTTAREAMDDLREVLGVLRAGGAGDGTDLAPQPGAADIERVVEASRAAGVPTTLRMELTDLPDPVARAAYRVVRESLTNVHKHARGAATAVEISGDEARGVSVEVVNQRPVSQVTLLPGAGAGLIGLRERVGLLGGSLEYGPSADGGWRVAAWLPWHASSPGAIADASTGGRVIGGAA
jgi:signal transduction histidine kinase